MFSSIRIVPPEKPGRNYTIRLKIDTGAGANTIPMRSMRQIYASDEEIKSKLTHEPIKLTAYNGKTIEYIGTIWMNLHHNNHFYKTKFHVIDVSEANYKVPPVLGLQSCEIMNIISIHSVNDLKHSEIKEQKPIINDVKTLKERFPNSFDTIGNFEGKITLHLKDDAIPYIAPPRKCSIHMKDKIKEELDDMVQKGIIRKVDEHTDWCSNVCFVTKKDGSLRVCLDPKKLNENLKRCPHKIPTVEEMNPLFTGAKYFSKLDAKAGYWSVKLDQKSQLITTFRSPLGQRYCFLRLPFGLNVSQDDFQRKMDEILENLPGVTGIADDVCVSGATGEEHDENLINLMTRAEKKGLVFNSSKCAIKQTEISFFGNVYTQEGIKPDPKKVEDIRNMPIPENKDDLRRFLGMITYLSQFIKKFSDKTQVLRDLLKNSSLWCWEEVHNIAYNTLKTEISDKSVLHYFDISKEIVLEVDASMKGLGAAITQEGKPVAFASKALTETQSRYSNIEREMLAVVAGCERFHTLLYGKSFKVITDHKPLVAICGKTIHNAPPRLQRMLLRLQGYSFDINYRPGSEMIIADTLSRLPNKENKGSIDLDIRVDNIEVEIDSETIRNISMINFSAKNKQNIVQETLKDPILNTVKEVVHNGWPDSIKELQQDIRPYWSYREELAIEGGVLFKSRQVIIPQSMREDILMLLHQSHQGIEKTRSLSRESCYWPNINKDIEKICKECALCQEYQHKNRHEPITPYETPSKPWHHIASDLFEINGRQFLITADKYSKFPFVEEMTTGVTSYDVAQQIKRYCSILGRPHSIFSDNGPQYSGKSFQEFVNEWGINHVTSSPTYSQSNGFIERQIGHVKPLLRKAIDNNQYINLTLLNIRATPIDHRLKSPAEMLMGRPIVTLLPSRHGLGQENDREALCKKREEMIVQDKHANNTQLSPLYPSQLVRVLSHKNNRWFPATVIKADDTPNSYLIRSNNRIIRRNRHHIRQTVQDDPVADIDNHSENTPIRANLPNENTDLSPKRLFADSNSPVEQPVPQKQVTVAFTDSPARNIVSAKPPSQNREKIIEPNTVKMSRFGRVISKNLKYSD